MATEGARLVLTGLLVAVTVHSEFLYNVTENTEEGAVVADLTREKRYRNYDQSEMSFFMPIKSQYFVLDEGIIKTKTSLDREAIAECREAEACWQNMTCMVFINSYRQTIIISLQIIDVNDNSPKFDPDRNELHLREDIPTPHLLLITSATDPDSPRNGIAYYSLSGDESKFNLVEQGRNLYLNITKELDAETKSMYNLNITAYDGGTPRRRGSLALSLRVQDTNDNRPRFELPMYNVTLREDESPRRLLRLRATDADSGDNGRIVYSLIKSSPPECASLFSINAQTGKINLNGSLDYENNQKIILEIEARDHGNVSYAATTKVIVTVTDVNDNAPVIEISDSNDELLNEFTVKEDDLNATDNAVGSGFVGLMSVRDDDSGRNGMTNCSLHHSHFRLVPLAQDYYKLVKAVSLDREDTDQHTLTILCHDNGLPQLNVSRDVAVHVLDINDNAPVFNQSQYTMTFDENNPPELYLGSVYASDADIGENADLIFTLVGEANESFTIDERTGQIFANDVFDREEEDGYELTVIARDSSQSPLTASAAVSFHIEDEDDNGPVFQQGIYQFNVSENSPGKTRVGVVLAEDLDLAPNNNLIYRIRNQSRRGGYFSIDPTAGIIFTDKVLDRETRDNFVLTVESCSEYYSTCRKSSTAQVRVRVLDTNDHHPEVLYPIPNNFTVDVAKDARINDLVTRISASDPDDGDNGRLTYSIVKSTDEDDLFSMRENTGEIVVKRELVDFSGRSYSILIKVRDHGEKVMMTTRDIVINIVDEVGSEEPTMGGLSSPLSTTHLAIIVGVIIGCLFMAFILIFTIIIIRRRNKMAAAVISKQKPLTTPSELYWARSDLVSGVSGLDDMSPTDSDKSGKFIDPNVITLKGEDAVAAKMAVLAEMKAADGGSFVKLAAMHPPSRDQHVPEAVQTLPRRSVEVTCSGDVTGHHHHHHDLPSTMSTLPARCMQHCSMSAPHASKSPSKLASFSSWLSADTNHDSQPVPDGDDLRRSVRFDHPQAGTMSSLKKNSHVILANGNALPVSRADVCVLTDSHYPPYSADVGSLV